MAEATPQAPVKKAVKTEKELHLERCTTIVKQVFDTGKKYMFELASHNLERDIPVYEVNGTRSMPITNKKFKSSQNIVFTSQIVWPEGLKDPWSGKERSPGRYIIRYYDGCNTLFIDNQPQDRTTIDQLIKQTQYRRFLEGKFGCYGDETMLLMYLNICSWNTDSPFRTRTANAIFTPVDRAKIATQATERLDITEKALQLAKDATEQKMMIHAAYLGVPLIDYDSGNELEPAEIRSEYRKQALKNPELFTESYGNKKIELKYFISKALETGLIDVKYNPNKAVWASSKREICDIHGLKSLDVVAEKIFEHSQLESGEEFVLQLTALFV